MKDMTHCPLCGNEFPPSNAKKECGFCGAKEYRIPGIEILIGYLYPSEYQQFTRLRNIVLFLAFLALIVWYIWNWKISSMYPVEATTLIFACWSQYNESL